MGLSVKVQNVVNYGKEYGIASAMKRYENSDTAVLMVSWRILKEWEAKNGASA